MSKHFFGLIPLRTTTGTSAIRDDALIALHTIIGICAFYTRNSFLNVGRYSRGDYVDWTVSSFSSTWQSTSSFNVMIMGQVQDLPPMTLRFSSNAAGRDELSTSFEVRDG